MSSKKDDEYRFMFSPYTYHFSGKKDYKDIWLVGVERERNNGMLAGVTYFSNSFGQSSTYIFLWGQMYRDIDWMPGLYFKWTTGLNGRANGATITGRRSSPLRPCWGI